VSGSPAPVFAQDFQVQYFPRYASCARKMPLPKLVLLNAWFQTQAVFGAGPVSLVGDKAK
jgi:hypothetical protein